jgi:hypothetical protein
MCFTSLGTDARRLREKSSRDGGRDCRDRAGPSHFSGNAQRANVTRRRVAAPVVYG